MNKNDNTTSPILELQRQQLLLQMEYEEEKRAFDEANEARGIERLVRRGEAWAPIALQRSFYNSLNQFCVEIVRTGNDEDYEDVDTKFEYGRRVETHPLTPSPREGGLVRPEAEKSAKSVYGTVSYVDGNRMVIALDNEDDYGHLQSILSPLPSGKATGRRAPLGNGGLGGWVSLSLDTTSYRAMFDALDRTMRAKGRLAYLRDLFYTRGMKAETYSFPDMGFDYLNAAQDIAVNEVLRAKDVAVVHGPPGTGKTTTLVEAIYETLRREPQVLVCAQSNMAVDWISEKLVDRGLNVLRLGNPVRVDDKMLSFTYERRFESHPEYPQLWAVRKAIRQLRQNRKRGDHNYHQKMERLKDRATQLEITINAELFGEARVIACTLVGASHRLLDGHHFPTLFIDEAAQALEAACWIAIRRAGRVIFAGDHCQLPPTVKCYEALRGGLGKTLMERIVEQKPEVVSLLTTQYRMNEEIARFSSDWFYGNMVKSAPEVAHRHILEKDIPMVWISESSELSEDPELSENSEISEISESSENRLGQTGSIVNKREAELTLLALRAYFELIGKHRILDDRIDVAIISPYRAQVQLLRRLVKKQEFFRPFRHLITVNTVDGFQGQERDVVVISMVRSNPQGQIGFLHDLRRMNVAITRARMKVIIVGDRSTICRYPFYRRLAQYIDALSED